MSTKNQILTVTLAISVFAFIVTEWQSTKLRAWKTFDATAYNIDQIAISPRGNFVSTTSINTVAMNGKSPVYHTWLNVWDVETGISVIDHEITKKREKNSTTPFSHMRFSSDEWTIQFSGFAVGTPYAHCVRQSYICSGHMNDFMNTKKKLPNNLPGQSNPAIIREIDEVVYLQDTITRRQWRLSPQPLIGTAHVVSTESGDLVVGRIGGRRRQGEVVSLWRVPIQ
ncbi:MAG: hypothetical protein H8F28_19665 [Fibrella sp.]|nr:hypothetical protein [Armatimonadota bacterium]